MIKWREPTENELEQIRDADRRYYSTVISVIVLIYLVVLLAVIMIALSIYRNAVLIFVFLIITICSSIACKTVLSCKRNQTFLVTEIQCVRKFRGTTVAKYISKIVVKIGESEYSLLVTTSAWQWCNANTEMLALHHTTNHTDKVDSVYLKRRDQLYRIRII